MFIHYVVDMSESGQWGLVADAANAARLIFDDRWLRLGLRGGGLDLVFDSNDRGIT